MNSDWDTAEAAVTNAGEGTALFERFDILPAFRVRAAALPRIRVIESRISVVVLLIVAAIAALTWQAGAEFVDLLASIVELLAVFVPMWVLVSTFVASLLIRNEIEAMCRPRHIFRRGAYALVFIGLYVTVIAVDDSAWLRILAAAFLIAFVSLLWAFWRFARSYPVTECNS
ncbi:MAG: hypothetical protein WD314_01225 [Trueperaceae bacterium]